jgi:TRAP-type C4-dicarboxylate transport system permease small subunit
VQKIIRRLEQVEMAVAAICVVTIMLVVSADALGRYIFKAPLQVTFELVTFYLLIAAIYFALSETYRHGDHINIDLIHANLPKRIRAWVDIVCSALAAVVFAVIAYGAWRHMIEAYVHKEFIPGYIVWPVWLSYLPIPLGAALLVIRLLHHIGVLARRGEDPDIETHTAEVLE